MYSEDDLIQLSSLQHFVFCVRQCALIHIEQLWAENVLTAEGGMHAQKLIVFKHVGTDKDEKQKEEQAKLGCTPAHKLFDLVKIWPAKKKDDGKECPEIPEKPACSFEDYIVNIAKDACPKGVEIIEML